MHVKALGSLHKVAKKSSSSIKKINLSFKALNLWLEFQMENVEGLSLTRFFIFSKDLHNFFWLWFLIINLFRNMLSLHLTAFAMKSLEIVKGTMAKKLENTKVDTQNFLEVQSSPGIFLYQSLNDHSVCT